ncbi:hypothetical protein KAU55_00710 [Candidatus Bathyarchaeota archaeon]|nr:hypothetical protein [Candidatus Bathyarchaeota archaeon]
MVEEEFVLVAKWEYQDTEFRRMAADVDTVKQKVHASSESMGRDYLSLAGNVAHLGTAFMGLENIITRVSEGQMGLGEGMLKMLPTLMSLASASWAIVGAEKARAVATAIASAVTTFGASIPLQVAAATAAGLALTAVLTTVPSKQMGGYIPTTGPYLLHAGETVLPAGGTRNHFEIHVHVMGGYPTLGHQIGRDIIAELTAGGYV